MVAALGNSPDALASTLPFGKTREGSSAMSVREILQLGNPLLLARAEPVAALHRTALSALVEDLDDTLAAFRARAGFGRGIAAPQIGALHRVVFLRMPESGGFCGALVDPEIVWSSPETFELWDDCFSFPDLMVRVERAVAVRVRYLDESSAPRTVEAEGPLSELLQHEIDHLDGVLAIRRAVTPDAFATRVEWGRSRASATP